MKLEFGYSGEVQFEIKSHGGLFYLFKDGRKVAKSDDQKSLRTYIDGWADGYDNGYEKYFKKYMDSKLEIKRLKK